MRVFSVKEVRDLTGLTWKQLYEYKEGIPGIGPINEAGYKRYSEEDVDKLIQAMMLAKLGAKPKDINRVFTNKDYDRNKLLDDLEVKAKKKLEEINDILTVVEILKDMEINILNPYQVRDLHSFAEYLRSELNSEDVKKLEKFFEQDDAVARIASFLKKFEDITKDTVDDPSTHELVKELKDFVEKEIGVNGFWFLRVLANDAIANKSIKEGIDTGIKEGISEIIGEAIYDYLFTVFYEESDEELDKLVDLLGEDYGNHEVKECITQLEDHYMRVFGYRSKKQVFEDLKYLDFVLYDVDDSFEQVFDYFINGVRYYENFGEQK